MATAQTGLASGRILSPRRALLCAGAGLACGAFVGWSWSMELLPLVSWTVAATLAVSWVWSIGWGMDQSGTERLAEEESRSRSTDVWVLLAALASLATVVVALMRSSGGGPVAVASVLLSVAGVAVSWALVNTVYALKYARLYYIDEPDLGGFAFGDDGEPTYSDFAYQAFTIGMSFGVSEIEPTQTRTRRVVLAHAILSYVFGTGVVAVVINLVTNLGQ
jgi:uncharacterized membrane protein